MEIEIITYITAHQIAQSLKKTCPPEKTLTEHAIEVQTEFHDNYPKIPASFDALWKYVIAILEGKDPFADLDVEQLIG